MCSFSCNLLTCDLIPSTSFEQSAETPPSARSPVQPQTQQPVWEPGTYIYLRAALPKFNLPGSGNTNSMPVSAQWVQLTLNDEHLVCSLYSYIVNHLM